jgi:hypothetical protein
LIRQFVKWDHNEAKSWHLRTIVQEVSAVMPSEFDATH